MHTYTHTYTHTYAHTHTHTHRDERGVLQHLGPFAVNPHADRVCLDAEHFPRKRPDLWCSLVSCGLATERDSRNICTSIYLSIYLSFFLSIFLSFYLSIHAYIHEYIHTNTRTYTNISRDIFPAYRPRPGSVRMQVYAGRYSIHARPRARACDSDRACPLGHTNTKKMWARPLGTQGGVPNISRENQKSPDLAERECREGSRELLAAVPRVTADGDFLP